MFTIHRDTLLTRSEVDEPRSRLAVVVVSSFVYQLVPTNYITLSAFHHIYTEILHNYIQKGSTVMG